MNDLDFSQCGEVPNCSAVIHQKVKLGLVINYIWGGSIFFVDPKSKKSYVLDEGTCYWTFPHQVYHYGPVEKTWHQMWIVLNGSRAEEYRIHQWLPEKICFQKIKNRSRFEKKLRFVFEGVPKRGRLDSMRNVNVLESLLLDLKEERDLLEGPRNIDLIKDTIESIVANPFFNWSFEREAKSMSISLSHFRRLFRAEVGRPPQDFILRMRMENIAEKLRMRKDPVSSIAKNEGYENLHYFSRLFKKTMGVSPREYRKQQMFASETHSVALVKKYAILNVSDENQN